MATTTTQNIMDLVKNLLIQAGEEEWDTDFTIQAFEDKKDEIKSMIEAGLPKKTKKDSSPKDPTATHTDNYGIIFITEEIIFPVGVDDYQDRIYKDEFDDKIWSLYWKGQKKHRRDYIVTEQTRDIHVCARKKRGQHYTYYGKIKNESMRVMFQGDPQASEPSAYFFDLEIENEVAFKTVFDGDLAPQAQAIRTLGFNYNGGCSGIYKMWK